MNVHRPDFLMASEVDHQGVLMRCTCGTTGGSHRTHQEALEEWADHVAISKLETDGNHPDLIVVTYGRCNAGLDLAQDLMAIHPPSEWRPLALQMLDRDQLAEDRWWAALQRRRRRNQDKPLSAQDLPSYATRITAAHALMAAHLGRAHQPDPHHGLMDPAPPAGEDQRWEYPDAQRVAFLRAAGRCEAEGHHHKRCPQDFDPESPDVFQFVTHHIYPRERAKRNGHPDHPLLHHPANLLVVWNGYTRKGAGGCHGRIHSERTRAHELGFLAKDLSHVPTTPASAQRATMLEE